MGAEKEYTLKYDSIVQQKDVPRLDPFWRQEILSVIASKLTRHPDVFGKPLRQSLAGWRSLRVGDYRVVYEIRGSSVCVLGILHRSEVYAEMQKRLFL